MISSYTLRQKHKHGVWEATILAPDLLTAALFLKKRAQGNEMPTVHEKNGKRYTKTGNRAFYRNVKVDMLRQKKKVAPAKVAKALKDSADIANAEAVAPAFF